MIKLSIIIVNYRTPQMVIDCLRTIYGQTEAGLFEVIVVDNASGDGSEEIVLADFPSVRWIQMGYNSGFARANNEGIRRSAGEVVLLLNSDTLVENRAIEGCFRDFAASVYPACGVQLINPDRTPQISGNYFVRGGLNYLLPLPWMGTLVKRMGRLSGANVPNVPEARALVEVDWINGAFLMVRKDAITLAGLMDEDFFLYAEEIEWCSRLRRLGKLALYGQHHVVHIQGPRPMKVLGPRERAIIIFTTGRGCRSCCRISSGYASNSARVGFLFNCSSISPGNPRVFFRRLYCRGEEGSIPSRSSEAIAGTSNMSGADRDHPQK